MQTIRTLSAMILLISITFLLGNTNAEDPEFDFRFDVPDDGVGSVDPESTIDLTVAIENYLDEPREYELYITNSDDLESNRLDAWWSNDGQDDLSTESTQLNQAQFKFS